MSGQFIELNAPSLQGSQHKQPQDLPHGLLFPPQAVREIVAKEKAKFEPVIFTPIAEERMTNDLTLQYYFDYLGHEVLYRSTPEGPEVLAVGYDEILSFRKRLTLEEQLRLQSWLP